MIGAVAGCFEEEKINVQILFKDATYDVEILKGTKLDIAELDFISNKSDTFLLYGENFDTKYNNEILTKDTVFLACDYNGTELLGTFYTLQDAYTQGIISDGDLQDVCNNCITPNKPKLDKQVELKILNDRLVNLKCRETEASLEDVSIYGYYGNYNNAYVIRLSDKFTNHPDVVEELAVGNVTFEYSGAPFLVWIDEVGLPVLTEEASNYIKNIFANKVNEFSAEPLSADNVVIKHYFGKFKGAYVAVIEGDEGKFDADTVAIGKRYSPVFPMLKPEPVYLCITKHKLFRFSYLPEIISVYYDGEYYTLPDACKLDLFNESQIQRIYSIYLEITGEELTNELVPSIESKSFYNLQAAYTAGLLSVEDLEKIAVYHNNGLQAEDKLDAEITSEIKKIAAYYMQNDESYPVIDAKAEDFMITKYYGTYNNCVIFMINDPYFVHPSVDLGMVETIAGIDFRYSWYDRILVFINN